MFALHQRCQPTYGSFETRLCNKIYMAISMELQAQEIAFQNKLWFSHTYERARTRRFILLPILCCKVSLGQSMRRRAPWMGQNDFGFHLVLFRCVISRDNTNVSVHTMVRIKLYAYYRRMKHNYLTFVLIHSLRKHTKHVPMQDGKRLLRWLGFLTTVTLQQKRLGGSFFIRIHVPPHVRSGLQIVCETKVKTGGKKCSKAVFLL